MQSLLRPLLYRHAASSFDKQLYLANLVGEADWRFDLAAGLLSFGDRFHWRVQLLGTEAEETHTWLWAWANDASDIPPDLVRAAAALRILGRLQNIPEITEPEVPLGEVDGHTLALIASGLCQANAYYRAPYDGGALFLLIQDDIFPRCQEPPLARIASVFPQAIAAPDIANHRLALAGHLAHYGIDGRDEGDRVLVREAGQPVLTATFDEVDRLTKLNVTVKGGKQ
jgi:hypothetical protein